MRLLIRMLALVALTVFVIGSTGCATTDDDISDIPWGSPEQWEGSPGIPGMEGY